MFVEYRVNGGEWQADPHHVIDSEDPECPRLTPVSATGRDYDLFAALAGVRGDGPEALGLPDDVSSKVKAESDRWDGDGHSHSYISLKDFKNVLKKFSYYKKEKSTSKDAFYAYENYDYKTNPHPPDFITLINYCDDIENQIDWVLFDKHVLNDGKGKYKIDVRLVFWFDN